MITFITLLLSLVALLAFKIVSMNSVYYYPSVKLYKIIDIILTILCWGVGIFTGLWLLKLFIEVYNMIPSEALYGV